MTTDTQVLIAGGLAVLPTAAGLAADNADKANANKGLRIWAKAPVAANKATNACRPAAYAALNPIQLRAYAAAYSSH